MFIVVPLVVMGVIAPPAADADELAAAVQRKFEAYREKLGQLADWCESQGLAEPARRTRAWLQPVAQDRLLVPILPNKIGGETPSDEAAPAVQDWYQKWMALRRQQAEDLFALARGAVRQGRAGLALDLALRALHENPDHEALRRIFGYQPYAGEWRTRYEVGRLRAGQIWDDRFGWIPKAQLPRFERGERPAEPRWVSAEEDARRRRETNTGWTVDTEHFQVWTDHSLEGAALVGKKLETLHELWSRLFVRYYLTEAQVLSLFDARSRAFAPQPMQHKVVVFRTRSEYNEALRNRAPQIEITGGMYVGDRRTAYFFFHDPPEGGDLEQSLDVTTVYHEATHQLFYELGRVAPTAGRRSNFWVIEGAAMYMETLRREGDFLVLGGIDTPRMIAARFRRLQDGFYIPFREFTAMTMDDWQSDARIGAIYSQAAGITNFLIHYDGGKYREAMVQCLLAVYRGTDTPDALARLTGRSFAGLDEEYLQYLKAMPPLPPMRLESR
ncbi:MAG: hypothetical protein Kow0040_30340 [Thermogutta sp.]